MTCNDCGNVFEEAEALNASLDPNEFNAACPKCGGDHVTNSDPSHELNQPTENDNG